MYTAVITKIIGNQQETREYDVWNHTAFQQLTADLIPGTRVSVCPYDLIVTAGKRGVYYLATLHRNDGTTPHHR